jgi:dUTP pyrophosphatase
MRISIKRIDQTLPLPEYKTAGAVAVDLASRIDLEIPAQTIALIPLNVIIKTPPGYFLLIAARSSTPLKKNLMCANGLGIVDEDFCGAEDEIKFEAYNFTDQPVKIIRGERIAQALFVKIDKAEFEEISSVGENTRGGFGSTG